MPSPTLGNKRACPSCGARFYDLNKKPITCPKCAFSFEPDVLLKPRRPRTPEKVKAVEAPLPAEDETPDYEEESESEETLDPEGEESESETEEPVLPETSEDEEEEEKPLAQPKGRRGATEEVDPDLIEVDEDEALEGEEADDTLIEPDEEEDSDLSDIEIGKDDEDR